MFEVRNSMAPDRCIHRVSTLAEAAAEAASLNDLFWRQRGYWFTVIIL